MSIIIEPYLGSATGNQPAEKGGEWKKRASCSSFQSCQSPWPSVDELRVRGAAACLVGRTQWDPWESDGRVAASGTVAPLMACPFKFNNFLNLKVARRDTPARCHTVCAASRPGQFGALRLAAWWAWCRRSELTALRLEAPTRARSPNGRLLP